MNTKDIAFLACRFFALYIVFEQINIISISTAPFFLRQPTAEVGMIGALLGSNFLCSLIAFYLFWFKAEWIASKIAANHSSQQANTPANRDDIQNAGFAIVGMLVIAKTIPLVASQIALYFFSMGKPPLTAYYTQLSVELIIGISLLLGADGITSTIKKLRGNK